MKLSGWFFVLLSAVFLTGCNSIRPPMPEALSLQPVAGIIQRYDDSFWFKPCYERLWWPVSDYTEKAELSQLYSRLVLSDTEGLYLEADGAVDPDQDHTLLISSVRVAGGTEDTCAYRIDGLEFRAANTSPYWIADISTGSVVVKSANPLGRYSFLVASEIDETGLVYRETTDVSKPFSIRLIEQRCEDSSNGSVLDYRAEMTLFGHPYQGCARQGHKAQEQLAGYYWFSENGVDQVVMNLSEDKRAQLVHKDSEGKVTSERGNWQFLQSGKLILSMKRRSGKEFLVLFRRQENGEFLLQSSGLKWAPKQAAFVLWRPSGLPGGRLLPVANDQLAEPLRDEAPVITVPDFNPVEASPDGDQLEAITVSECSLNTIDQAC